MRFLYNISVYLFGFLIRIISPFNEKARKWIHGRKNWEKDLELGIQGIENAIWVHCSSLGEFEQGRPIIEKLHNNGEKVILSFFSPSGYENLKDFPSADFVTYLPLDTTPNARKWLKIIKPKAVFFVKYEFWFNFIREIKKTETPLLLISGIFRKEQYFFKWYGKWGASQLKSFSHFFLQDENSVSLLSSIGINNTSISGDSRFDRVYEISLNPKSISEVESFCRDQFTIIAGSTWPEDEELLLNILQYFPEMQLIIAAHDINKARIKEQVKTLGSKAVVLNDGIDLTSKQILFVDKIGLLSSLYRYGQIAFVGGGFGSGIHNILEAAVYEIPVVFGPKYEKFREARDLIEKKGAYSISDTNNLKDVITFLLKDQNRNKAGQINREYVVDQKGATKRILNYLEEREIVKNFEK